MCTEEEGFADSMEIKWRTLNISKLNPRKDEITNLMMKSLGKRDIATTVSLQGRRERRHIIPVEKFGFKEEQQHFRITEIVAQGMARKKTT